MWATMLLKHWKWIAIGLLTFALALSTLHGRAMKAERDEKIAVIDFMKREAEAFHTQSEINAKETSDAFTTLTDQIKGKDLALLNAKKRFGSCNVAGGITAVRLPNVPTGTSEASIPESPGGVPTEERVAIDREHIDDYATCIGFVKAVKEWRVANQLPISEE